MRVGLNLLYALPEIGGAWNYIQNLLQALGRLNRTDTFLAFATPESEGLIPDRPNFERIRVNIRSASRPRRIAFENTAFFALARSHRLDCLHWFANTQSLLSPAPSVVTVHDLQPFYRLAPFPLTKRLYLKLMMTETARRASVLSPVSEATAAGLNAILGVEPSRMVVVHTALAEEFTPGPPCDVDSFRERYHLPERFWLYVAHFYPHKNHLGLLDAWRILRKDGLRWPLVFRGDDRGAEPAVRERVRELGFDRDVVFLPRFETRELRLLYSAATALVFPSLFEGGGIPVVEAMACGLAVAASRIPPLVEFAGPAALYFNPRDAGAMANAMRGLAENAGTLEIRRRAGLARADDFRPASVVPKILKAYARAALSR